MIDEEKKLEITTLFNKDYLDLNDIYKIISLFNEANTNVEDKNITNLDYINAFVAMGGDFECESYISKKILIQTINEFGIKINLEEILEKLMEKEDDKIYFHNFCVLFENNNIDDNKSVVSFVSVK